MIVQPSPCQYAVAVSTQGTKSIRKATEPREFDVIEAENKSGSPRYEIKLFSTSQNQIINLVTSSAAITVNYATNKAFLLEMNEMKIQK